MSFHTKHSKSFLSETLNRFFRSGKTRFYLSELVEEAKVSMQEAEDFIIPLLRKNKLEGRLELRCPNCGKDLGIYNKISDIPEEIFCEICGHQFDKSLEYIEIILEIKKAFFRHQKKIGH